MSLNAELEHLAYCGVDCSACADYIGGKCPGCRMTDRKDDPCMPVACCRGRGIEFCGECPDFPCEDMRAFYKESPSHERAFRIMMSIEKA